MAPEVKENSGARFYNPGDRINEPLNYSIEGADIHTVARWILDAPKESYFNVPTELKILNVNERVVVDFPTTVCLKFGNRGVTMIDPDHEINDDSEEEDKIPIARTEEEAKAKGDRVWKRYLWNIVRAWQQQCAEIRSKGNIPMEASGFTRRALELLGMKDPATVEMQQVQAQQSTDGSTKENAELKARIDNLESMLRQALGKKKADEDAADLVAANARTEKATSKTRK